MPPRTAILIVNGFDRRGLWGTRFDDSDALRFPWIDVCLREVARRSRGSAYEVMVWDNSQMAELRDVVRRHEARLLPADDEIRAAVKDENGLARALVLGHGRSLDRLWSHVGDDFEFVVTLDTDAFPIRDGWIESLQGLLERPDLAGIWRDEMAPQLEPFVHPSCMIVRRRRLQQMPSPFSVAGMQDVGQRITREIVSAGGAIAPLKRSNARNAHFVIGGVYGDLVYHHGAGSRVPLFRNSSSEADDAYVYSRLRAAVFDNLDRVVGVLTGRTEGDLGVELTAARAGASR